MEPLNTLRRTPALFVSGFAVIVAAVVMLSLLLAGSGDGLRIGVIAGFQGGAYLILYRFCRVRAEAKEGN